MRLPNTERAFKSWQRQQKALLDKLGEPGTSHKHNMALLKALEASDRAFRCAFYMDTKDINQWDAVKHVSVAWLKQMAKQSIREGSKT